MFCADHLTLDAPQRTRDGFLKVRARAARTGIYDYAGAEVDPNNEHGLRDKAIVKVYRPGDQVFDRASLASFVGKPITDNHPSTPVTRDNWRDHARGTIMGAVRDGEYVAFDLMLTDGATIDAVEGGKRELSNGYATDLKFEPGTAPDGTAYDAVQTSITGNHIALVDKGRAGSECRISDRFAVCDANPARVAELSTTKQEDRVKVINLDGMSVNLSDATAVEQTIATLDNKLTAALADKATVDGELSTLKGEKAVLEKSLADAKAELDPATLDARVADRAALVDKAKALKSDIVTDGKSDAEIRKEVVSAKLGDAAANLDDAAVVGAFAALTADAKPVDTVEPFTPRANVTTDAAATVSALRIARYS